VRRCPPNRRGPYIKSRNMTACQHAAVAATGDSTLMRQNAAVMLLAAQLKASGTGPSRQSVTLTYIFIGIFQKLIYHGRI
jgi:hypothetical protein